MRPDDLLLGIDREEVLYRSKWRCHYCGEPLNRYNFQVDHRIPKDRGGTDELENLVASCQPCNSSKGARNDAEFPTR